VITAVKFIITFHLIVAHQPNGQELFINPDEIVALRAQPQTEGHLKEGVRCIVSTTDGKFLTVTEECQVIQMELERIRGIEK
jgi:uncharacterized protein YlzI (FlbEa/FlbD family)